VPASRHPCCALPRRSPGRLARRALEVFLEVRRDPRIRLEQATQAAQVFLEALGVDLARSGRKDTPARMARAYAELPTPRPFLATHFPNDEGYDQMVLAKEIPFTSVCEHHMLVFTGVAYLGYLPGDRILGLSKLARLVEHFAAAPQMQERLTKQIAEWLNEHLEPRGVGVVLEAEHTCMTLRGVQPTTPAWSHPNSSARCGTTRPRGPSSSP